MKVTCSRLGEFEVSECNPKECEHYRYDIRSCNYDEFKVLQGLTSPYHTFPLEGCSCDMEEVKEKEEKEEEDKN